MDGRIEWRDGLRPVFEGKSLHPNVFSRIESANDFIRLGGFWTKYPRQMLCYLLHSGEQWGLWILDDCLGHWKIIPIDLFQYLDACEAALQTAKLAAEAVALREPPPYYDDPRVCRDCWAFKSGLCMPPILGEEPISEVDNPGILYALSEAERLRSQGERFSAAVDNVKDYFKALLVSREPGTYRFIAGDFIVNVEKRATKRGAATYVTWGAGSDV